MTRARSSWLAVLRFERRIRRRTERRVAELRPLLNGAWAPAGIAGAAAFGVVLGVFVALAATNQRQAAAPQVVVVPVTGLIATGGEGHDGSRIAALVEPPEPVAAGVGRVADPVAVPEDPEVRAAEMAAVDRTAADADADVAGAASEPGGNLAALEPDESSRPPVVDTPPSGTEMPSVEQGPPPATGDAAKPPKQTRLAGLPIPPKPQWLRNAIRTPDPDGAPMIAVIVDDVGVNQARSREAVRLPGPLTIAFIPYGNNLKTHVAAARRAGHEIMVHIPMQPLDPGADPGPNALLTDLDPDELLRRLRWDLDRFDGYVGVSNHMGSRFTVWDEGMRLVMREVRRRGLLYVDSWTHNKSLGMPMSRRFRVPNAARDIFIDHDITEPAIRRRLGKLERIASRRGYAVGIAHPYRLSMEILEEWIHSVQARGYRLVPISTIVRHRLSRR